MARAPAEVSDFHGPVGTGKPIVVPCTQRKQVPQGTGPHPGHPLATGRGPPQCNGGAPRWLKDVTLSPPPTG